MQSIIQILIFDEHNFWTMLCVLFFEDADLAEELVNCELPRFPNGFDLSYLVTVLNGTES